MKIYSNEIEGADLARAERPGVAGLEKRRESKAATASNSPGSDELSLSSHASWIAKTLSAQSPERQNYVQALSRQYASGQYKVDAGTVADRLLRNDSSQGQADGGL